MGYLDRLQAAEQELTNAQKEYEESIQAAKREVAEAEKEHQVLLQDLAKRREEESNRLNEPVAECRGYVLYPDRLSYEGMDRTLLNGVETSVGVGTTESVLTIATPEVRVIIRGVASEEGTFRTFARKVKETADSASTVLKEVEENIAEIDHMREEIYERTPRMEAAVLQLEAAKGNTARIDEAKAAFDDLKNSPTEEDLAELAAYEEEERERAAAEAAAAEAAKKEMTKRLGIIGGAVLAIVAVLAILFGTHILCIHNWVDATCEEPQTCSICGRTQGEPLGHDWMAATCTKPKTCNRCGKTEGKAKGHEWEDATCTEPKTCSVCGATEGESLGHDIPEWTTDVEATCTQEGHRHGVCTRCGEDVEEDIPMLPHTEGGWVVTQDVRITSSGSVLPGERALTCSVCGAVLRTESFTIEVSVSQRNALRTADSYLSFMPFSHQGLVEQLEYEGYSHEDAVFAADHCGADWFEQAAESARSYLSFMGFSRSGLIDQLMYEGFTREQAEYGADAVGL